MKTPNTIEQDIDRIRLQLYEETKHLTIDERVTQSNERARRLAAQYGFTIGTPKDRIDTAKVVNG